jgi:hypothetical protein
MELMSKETDKIFAALSNAQKVMKGAAKDSTNPFYKSKYADLGSCIEAGKEALCQNGLCIAQTMEPLGDKICIATILGHTSGQWVKSLLPMPIEKGDPQTLGKAIAYCRRYAYAAIISLYQEDDDAESSMNRDKKPVQSYAPRKISEEQCAELDELLREVDNEEYVRKLAGYLKVPSLYDMDARDFERTMKSIEKKIQEQGVA